MSDQHPQSTPPSSEETRMLSSTKAMPHVEPRSASARRRMRRSTSFVPPLWSMALMLVGVACVSGGVVIGIWLLRAEMPPQSDPIVIVVTSERTVTAPAAPSAFPSNTPAFSGGVSIPLPTFELEGPTLPPVILTPTPDTVSVGRTVEVINVGENGLNVRVAPGTDQTIEFAAAENTFLEIIGGPEDIREDGFTWWRVRDPFSGQEGWAVELYMEVQPEVQ